MSLNLGVRGVSEVANSTSKYGTGVLLIIGRSDDFNWFEGKFLLKL